MVKKFNLDNSNSPNPFPIPDNSVNCNSLPEHQTVCELKDLPNRGKNLQNIIVQLGFLRSVTDHITNANITELYCLLTKLCFLGNHNPEGFPKKIQAAKIECRTLLGEDGGNQPCLQRAMHGKPRDHYQVQDAQLREEEKRN